MAIRIVDSNKVAMRAKYLCATESMGARVKAYCNGFTATVAWDYEQGNHGNYANAFSALCEKMGWKDGEVIMGFQESEGFCVFSK